jgi:hypothetical protein
LFVADLRESTVESKSKMDDDLRARVMELESELMAANSEIDSLREQLDHPDRTKENELYSLDRRATLSETKNKGEHQNGCRGAAWHLADRHTRMRYFSG